MKAPMAIAGTALFLLATPPLAATPSIAKSSRSSETEVLQSLEHPSLLSLRGGAVAARAAIGDAERETLRAAEARSPDLGSMRGGAIDLSDHDVKLIAIAAVVLLILILI